MDFKTAVQTCFSNYATFSGRAHRPEYWWFALFNVLGSLALAVFDILLGIDALSTLFSLAVLLPSLAVGARRLHDIGRSGWWLLLWFIPLIGQLVMIYWAIQPGDQGTNEFGPPPPA